jgi:DNA methyltransferase 1-associated protein 1
MGDVRDILGMEKKKTAGVGDELAKIKGSKRAAKQVKKPTGMSREVYALVGKHGLPSMVPTRSIEAGSAGFKKKRNTGPVHWGWTPFSNDARTDPSWGPLQLSHWVKAGTEYPTYPFAQFNKKLNLVDYTDAEYDQYLQMPGWSKPETDHLFELCKRLDLRWVVIHDRYQMSPPKALEELQERYYSVVTKLNTARKQFIPSINTASTGASSSGITLGDDGDDAETGDSDRLSFDCEYEMKRRAHLSALFVMTKEEEQEDKKLRAGLRDIDSKIRKAESSAMNSNKAGGARRAGRSSYGVSTVGLGDDYSTAAAGDVDRCVSMYSHTVLVRLLL